MRKQFKDALLHIILGPFTNTNGLLWSAYREHLRDIDPADLPKKIQPLFEELKGIYESRFDAALEIRRKTWETAKPKTNGMGYSWWKSDGIGRWGHDLLGTCYNWHNECKPTDKELYEETLNSDLMHNVQHVTAKRIKELMFEIIEKLPKRVRKPKLGKGT